MEQRMMKAAVLAGPRQIEVKAEPIILALSATAHMQSITWEKHPTPICFRIRYLMWRPA